MKLSDMQLSCVEIKKANFYVQNRIRIKDGGLQEVK